MADFEHAGIIGNLTDNVNGFITDSKNSAKRSEYRPMLDLILERIEQRLDAVGLDAATASARAGLSKDAIRNIQRTVRSGKGEAGVSTMTIISLAPVLQTTPSWLLEGTDFGAKEMPESARKLWEVFLAASHAPPAIQDRIVAFAEFQLQQIQIT